MYLLLFCLWLALNGAVTWEILLIGAAIVAALGFLMYALLGHTPKKDLRFLMRVPLFLVYVLVLLYEMIRANLRVIGIILRKKQNLRQSLVIFDTDLRTRFGRFLLANSITLTPGTITVRVEGSRFTVHCLHRDMIEGINEGALMKLLRKMEV